MEPTLPPTVAALISLLGAAGSFVTLVVASRRQELRSIALARKSEMELLRDEVARLHTRVEALTLENVSLHEENTKHRAELNALRALLATQQAPAAPQRRGRRKSQAELP